MPLETAIFGPIDTALDDYWGGELMVDGQRISVDLNVENASVDADALSAAIDALDDADGLAASARNAIIALSERDDEDPLALYFEHHRDELTPAVLSKALNLDSPDALTPGSLVANLGVRRIGLYPGSDEVFVIDFGLPNHLTNYLLSVKLDASRTPTAVDMES